MESQVLGSVDGEDVSRYTLSHGVDGGVDVPFQLELLGFIRRSLTQQPSIRAALYEGIVCAFEAQPALHPVIFELLLSPPAACRAASPPPSASRAGLGFRVLGFRV